MNFETFESMLIQASLSGDLYKFNLAIKNGADIHVHDDIALGNALYKGHFEILKTLVNLGANIHVGKEVPIRIAAFNKDSRAVNFLIDNGAYITRAILYSYEDVASIEDNIEIIKFIKKVCNEKFGEKFRCFNCLIAPICTEVCCKNLIKE